MAYQPGCGNYMTIKTGDTCDMIVDTYKLGSLTQLFNLNPDLNYAKCSTLNVGQTLCVGSGTTQVQPQAQPQAQSTEKYGLMSRLKNNRPLGVYYESWGEYRLSDIQPPINIVFLSFTKPDCTYTKGSNTFANTGLDFEVLFGQVKNSINLLKSRGIIVMLSIGGAGYKNWDGCNYDAIANLSNDLGVDGLDIDWEPESTSSAGKLAGIIESMKKIIPNGLISMAGYSTGAYINKYADSKPSGSSYKGVNAPGIQSHGNQLDFITIMSYDAGSYDNYNPIDSFNSYRDIYKGPLLLGFQPPPEGWGGGKITSELINKYTNALVSDKNAGVFVWSYKKNTLSPSPSTMEIINIVNGIFKNDPIPPQTQQQPPPKTQQQPPAKTQNNIADFIDMIKSSSTYTTIVIVVFIFIIISSSLSVFLSK